MLEGAPCDSGRGAVRSPARWLYLLLALGCLLALIGVGTSTAKEPAPRSLGAATKPSHAKQTRAEKRRRARARARLRARRRTPEARTQRRKSRTAFRALPGPKAKQVGQAAFPEQTAEPPPGALDLRGKERVVRYLGSNVAQIQTAGGK